MTRREGKRWLAIILTGIMCSSGLTAYAQVTQDHEYYGDYCGVEVVAGANETFDMEFEHIILPAGTVGKEYGTHKLSYESCGLTPVHWSLDEFDTEEVIPDGLTLKSNGSISGTPTESGEYRFWVGIEIGDKTASPSDAHPGGTVYELDKDPYEATYAESGALYFIVINEADDSETDDSETDDSETDDKENSGSDDDSGSSEDLRQGWVKNDGYWYFYNSGVYFKGWMRDTQDGYWYYLGTDGRMYTDWNELGGSMYYFHTGHAETWEMRGGEWYYKGQGRPEGSMYSNEDTPDGYRVGEDGVRID